MLKKLTIQKQLLIFSAVMLTVQILIAVVGYTSLYSIKGNLVSVFESRLPSINFLVQADRDFQQLLVAERSLLLEGIDGETRKSLIDDYKANGEQVRKRFDKYAALSERDEEKQFIEKFNKNFKEWQQKSKSKIGFSDKGTFIGDKSQKIKSSLNEVNKSFESSRDQMDKLQEFILKLGNEEFIQATQRFENSSRLIEVISLVGIVLSVFISIMIGRLISSNIKNVVNGLKDQNEHLVNISKDLGDRSQQLSTISQEQSSAVTETASSLNQISQMVKSNTENSAEAASLVNSSKELVSEGTGYLRNLDSSIKEVEGATLTLINKVHESNDQMGKILEVFNEVNDKTAVINDIVFQTKLLSFNASVEAARAGEHGKGFSVVAEEVGNLAKMSGDSASEISTLLTNSLEMVTKIINASKEQMETSIAENKRKIEQSVELSGKCQSTFSTISSNFDTVSRNSSSVADASQEQLSGVQEINKAVQEISGSSDLTSRSANNVQMSSDELNEIVQEVSGNLYTLRGIVEKDVA